VKNVLVIASLVLLSACAAGPQGELAAADTKVVCVKEVATGNLIPKTICRYEDAMARRSATDRETADRIQTEMYDVQKGR